MSSSDYTSSKLPQVDKALTLGGGYDPLSELMRAMLLRVVDDFNSKEEEVRLEAEDYLCAEEQEEYIFSFISICRFFNIDPDKTRDFIINPRHKIRTRRRAS